MVTSVLLLLLISSDQNFKLLWFTLFAPPKIFLGHLELSLEILDFSQDLSRRSLLLLAGV
jgi:hypothetical protein